MATLVNDNKMNVTIPANCVFTLIGFIDCAEDARYFVNWIDNLIEKTSPGHEWNKYFTHDLDVVQNRYRQAKAIYEKIELEAEKAE